MFVGKNESGKEFEVINEDREVIGACDTIADALAIGKSAHWSEGKCDIRRDADYRDRINASYKQASKAYRQLLCAYAAA